MLRGVNKQIVEVKQTNSPYFEKIYFIIKPEYSRHDYECLGSEASRLVEEIDFTDAKSSKKRRWLAAAAGAAIGAFCTFILFLLK